MIANLTSGLDFHSKALVLRAERQRVIASNIANADTPGYVARDLNFKEAMNNAIGGSLTGGLTTDSVNAPIQHVPSPSATAARVRWSRAMARSRSTLLPSRLG